MAAVDVSEAEFDSVIEGNDLVLVDFWAGWCAPCRQFAPIFERVSEEHPDLLFAKVDTDANQELAARAGISSIPTLMVFRDQVLVYAQPGAMSATSLNELIQAVRSIDMEKVHAEIAAESASGSVSDKEAEAAAGAASGRDGA